MALFKTDRYTKVGPGVSKSSAERKFGFADFFKSFKNNFWKLLSINILLTVVIVPLVVLGYYLTGFFKEDSNVISQKLKAHNADQTYISAVDTFCSYYKFDETDLDKANASVEAIIGIVEQKNPSVLTDGPDGFDSAKYSDADIETISKSFNNAVAALGFETKWEKDVLTVSDSKGAALEIDFSDGINVKNYIHTLDLSVFKYALCFLPLILLGPLAAVAFRMCRDLMIGNPVFFFSDLKQTIKGNWWQSLLIGAAQYVITCLLVIAIRLYYGFMSNGAFYVVGFSVCMIAAYVAFSTFIYAYLMQVTLDMKLKNIIKSAVKFSIISLWRNFLIVILTILFVLLLIVTVVYSMAYPFIASIGICVMLIVGFVWWFYMATFISYPQIKRIVVDPYYEQQNANNQNKVQESNEETEDELPEYVYYNGKMVHRSAIEKETLFDDDVE